MKRKVIYGVIYVGIAVAFPDLPLGGLRFLGGVVSGTASGLKDGGTEYMKEEGKEKAIDIVTEIKGPLWKVINPFE